MKKYSINMEMSRAVCDECRSRIALKECYNNVFKIATEHITEFRAGRWCVAYGYMTISEKLLCRHCFIIDESDRVIDVTLPLLNSKSDAEYFVFHKFYDFDDYLRAISHDENYPALTRYLREQDHKFMAQAANNGYCCIG